MAANFNSQPPCMPHSKLPKGVQGTQAMVGFLLSEGDFKLSGGDFKVNKYTESQRFTNLELE